MTTSSASDAELWRAAETNPRAFGEPYERHARAVFAFCARRTGDLALAEDLTSVVFLRGVAQAACGRPDGHDRVAVAAGYGEQRRAKPAQIIATPSRGAPTPADERRLAERRG